MANPEQLERLKQGVEGWNKWREEHPDEPIDLSDAWLMEASLSRASLSHANLSHANLTEAELAGAELVGANLSEASLALADLTGAQLWEADITRANLAEANLTGAHLMEANLWGAQLRRANLSGADLTKANLTNAHLVDADLRGAHLVEANLWEAHLMDANLSAADLTKAKLPGVLFSHANLTKAHLGDAFLARADLREANLTGAHLEKADLGGADLAGASLEGANLGSANLTRSNLVETHLEGADLTGSRVYGISAWDVHLDGATQTGLVITHPGEPEITVDDLEVAQFIYLLSRSEKLRKVIDTLGSKGVLIIGRFTKERLKVLHAIRDELRKRHDLLPIMFEFDPQAKKTTIETLLTLAHMSRFVIADLTDAKAVVQEVTEIVKSLPSLPIKLIIHESGGMPSMSDSFSFAESVLEPYVYRSREALLEAISPEIIEPANAKAAQLEERLAEIRRKSLPWQNRKKLAP